MSKIYKSKSTFTIAIKLAIIVVLAVFIIYAVWYMADALERSQNEEALMATENAIVKSAVQCYAIEGQYPSGLEYLEENYGLSLDRERYIYHYESVGANMVPKVKVFPVY